MLRSTQESGVGRARRLPQKNMTRAEECEKRQYKETNLHMSANDQMSKFLHTHPQSKYAVEENYMEHLETQRDPSPTYASSSWITGNRWERA